MSTNFHEKSENGNSMEDWCAFEVLCGRKYNDACYKDHSYAECNVDIVTTLRSELCALSYKNEKLQNELSELRGHLAVKKNECENLRAQTARQTALIGSLHNRLDYAEKCEQYMKPRIDKIIETHKEELREGCEKERQLIKKIEQLECIVENEKIAKQQLKMQLCNLLQGLRNVFGFNEFEIANITQECVITRAKELLVDLQRSKEKNNYTSQTLSCCEHELTKIKNMANLEKQRLNLELESSNDRIKELETRCREYEREFQTQHESFAENELCAEKMKQELCGLESRCFRLQNNLDRLQTEHHNFLRTVANELEIDEPCAALIKSKISELLNDNNLLQEQIKTLRHEYEKFKQIGKSNETHLRVEEGRKCELDEDLQKSHFEVQQLRKEKLCLLDYLKRLAYVFNWSDCFTSHNVLHGPAENLLQHVENFVHYCESHGFEFLGLHNNKNLQLKDCNKFQSNQALTMLRRERSCNDMTLKESTNIYNLQRRIRILREQIQKRDLQLELIKRKLSIVNTGRKTNCILQSERDEALNRAKRAAKQIDQLSAQIADIRAQLAEAIEYKIISLERARKIDELSQRISKLISEKTSILQQRDIYEERLKSIEQLSEKKRCHYEDIVNGLRQKMQRMESKLIDANSRLSQLQAFRVSVAHMLHIRDMPETHLLQRLQILCSAHRDFQNLTKRLENSEVCSQCDDSDETIECHQGIHKPIG